MKVQITYTINATPEYRRAINHYFGRPGMATREQVRSWLRMNGTSCDDDILFELHQAEEEVPSC